MDLDDTDLDVHSGTQMSKSKNFISKICVKILILRQLFILKELVPVEISIRPLFFIGVFLSLKQLNERFEILLNILYQWQPCRHFEKLWFYVLSEISKILLTTL